VHKISGLVPSELALRTPDFIRKVLVDKIGKFKFTVNYNRQIKNKKTGPSNTSTLDQI
jgi:hypothetical protein